MSSGGESRYPGAGLDLGFFAQAPPEIGPAMARATDGLAALQANATHTIDGQLREAARVYGGLVTVPIGKIESGFRNAAGTLSQLQQVAETDLAGRLGGIQEENARYITAGSDILNQQRGIPTSGTQERYAGTYTPQLVEQLPGVINSNQPTPYVASTPPNLADQFVPGGQYVPPIAAGFPGPAAMTPQQQIAAYAAGVALGQQFQLPGGGIGIGTNPNVAFKLLEVPPINPPIPPPPVAIVPPPVATVPPVLSDVSIVPVGTPPPPPSPVPPLPFVPVPGLLPNIAQNDPNTAANYGRINYPSCPIVYQLVDDRTIVVGQTDKIIDPAVLVSGCTAQVPVGCKINRDPLGNVFSVNCGTQQNVPSPNLPPPNPTQYGTPPPPQNCPCCCCNHTAETPCPAGSVRIDGVCQVDPRGKKYAAWYAKDTGQCSFGLLATGPAITGGELVAVADSADEARLAAASVCKPAIMPGVSPSKPTFNAPTDAACALDLYAINNIPTPPLAAGLTSVLQYLVGSDDKWQVATKSPSSNPVDSIAWGIVSTLINQSVKINGTLAVNAFSTMNEIAGVRTPAAIGFATALSLSGVVEKYLGGPWDYLTLPLQYGLAASRPLRYPSAGEAANAWLHGQIDDSILRTWVQQNGNCWEPYKKIIDSQQQLATPDLLLQWLRRGLINEGQFKQRMRQLGFIDQELVNDTLALKEAVPPPSDLVRFMVRDVEDRNIYERFRLDTDFTAKFQGNTKKWAEWQGISEAYMRNVWRAHWSIPSPTELYEMFHRLSRLPEGDDRRVSFDDIKTALEQQDIAPFWVEKLLAVSYRRLRLVDVRRAYEIGSIDRARVKEFYRELGYTEDNSELLTKFAEKNKLRSGHNHIAVKQWMSYVISEAEMHTDLRADGFSEEEINKIIIRAKQRLKAKTKAVCQKGIRHQFLTGILIAPKAREKLIEFGFDGTQAQELLSSWQCEQAAKGKELPASQIGRLFIAGLVDANEFYDRLLKLGYADKDATRIVTDYARRLADKITAASEKQRKALMHDTAKSIADNTKAQKQLERQAKQAQAASKLAKAAKLRRQKAIATAAAKWSDACGLDLAEALVTLSEVRTEVQKEYGLTADETVQAIVTAVEHHPADGCDAMLAHINRIASAFALTPSSPDE